MSIIIKKCTINELECASTINRILDEYAQESAIDGMPHPLAQVEIYRNLEKLDAIQSFGAFSENELIGYIILLAPVLPHYSVRVVVSESFFVLKDYRKTGAGLKLLRAAEEYVRDIVACGILVSAPIGGSLERVLPNVGYTKTNSVFFKGINNE